MDADASVGTATEGEQPLVAADSASASEPPSRGTDDEMEACRRRGAIPRRWAALRCGARVSTLSPPGDTPEESSGQLSHEAQLSREAERELSEYLASDHRDTPRDARESGEVPSPESPSVPSGRAGPEGREREPEYQEPSVPAAYLLRSLPIPTPPLPRDPWSGIRERHQRRWRTPGSNRRRRKGRGPGGRGRRGANHTIRGGTWRSRTMCQGGRCPLDHRPRLRSRRGTVLLRRRSGPCSKLDRQRARGRGGTGEGAFS